MNINADFSKRAVVHAGSIPWVDSPIPGVQRRMLDRIGDEVARATSIVRYAPGSRFSEHTHHGGEEFLVLEGVFQDEHGDYPAGTYVRNPPTTHHVPRSDHGCMIFVKLRQFDLADHRSVVLNINEVSFMPAMNRNDVSIAVLFENDYETVRVERWNSHADIDCSQPDGVELLVLEGSFVAYSEEFLKHSWLRLPRGTTLRARSGTLGAKVWIKSGRSDQW